MKKTLIMVCNDADRKYATYIQQLISAFDDSEDGQVGTKDGSVDAVIWDEKHYRDNLKSLNSTNHILFIGNTDCAKEARRNMDMTFDKLGMKYGWLGTQAFMFVEDNSLNRDNLEEFKALCAEYGKSFEKDLDLHFSPKQMDEALKAAAPETPKDLLPVPLGFLSPVLGIASAAAMHGKKAIDVAGNALSAGADLLQAGEAKDQQYTLLALIMYMDGLPEFLDA